MDGYNVNLYHTVHNFLGKKKIGFVLTLVQPVLHGTNSKLSQSVGLITTLNKLNSFIIIGGFVVTL